MSENEPVLYTQHKEQERLVSLYPEMFSELFKYGFACPTGWFHIVSELTAKLNSEFPGQIHVVQIKEKFGGLRYYVHHADKAKKYEELVDWWHKVHEVIGKAENEAWHTCDACGAHGELRQTGWHRVTCNDCEEKRKMK